MIEASIILNNPNIDPSYGFSEDDFDSLEEMQDEVMAVYSQSSLNPDGSIEEIGRTFSFRPRGQIVFDENSGHVALARQVIFEKSDEAAMAFRNLAAQALATQLLCCPPGMEAGIKFNLNTNLNKFAGEGRGLNILNPVAKALAGKIDDCDDDDCDDEEDEKCEHNLKKGQCSTCS